MNDWLRWFGGGDVVPGSGIDLAWATLTVALSLLVAAGYVVIAVNRHFQAKLARVQESKAAFARLRNIVLCSAVMGAVFYATDMFWLAWRAYDVLLVALAYHTWSFAWRMRGLGLVDERLAEVAEIERSARKYREIAEYLPQVVWTATASGGIDFFNRSWAEYAGQDVTWLEAVHPDERTAVLEWWERAVASRQPADRETRLADARGEYRTFLVRARPLARGEAVKWLGACVDVEDQRRAAAEKEEQARQRMFFLNALSHDLRAPLHNVALNAHILKQAARDQEEAESAAAIVENAVAAGDLVSKLLDFARVGGQEQNAVEPVEVGGALRQIARRFVPVAEAKGLYLRVVAAEDAELHTDRQKLERVVTNLVDNAIKFTRAGGVTIELSSGDAVAGAEGARDAGQPGGRRALVRVTDTGIGVPPEHAPHLFDEFYQVNNNPPREQRKGFGMGLAICRILARQLGGDVRLAATGPGGTTFEFSLPTLASTGESTARADLEPARNDYDPGGAVCFG